MQQQEQQQPGGWTPIQDAQKAANWFVLAARVVASPLEVILRKNFGSNLTKLIPHRTTGFMRRSCRFILIII